MKERERKEGRKEGREGAREGGKEGLHLSDKPPQCHLQHHLQEYFSTFQIKQFKEEMSSECEMIQLFNADCFMVLIKLSVLGSAF